MKMILWGVSAATLAATLTATLAATVAVAQVDTVLPEDKADAAKTSDRVSAEGRSYTDSQGDEVFFPIGDSSFADEVTIFQSGRPAATLAEARNPRGALGAPDYTPADEQGYVTLGCGGSLIAQFDDNVLVDVDGDDLYVFEIGAEVEPMKVSVSADGVEWIDIGSIGGATSSVDIAPYVEADTAYRFVRLEDEGAACEPSWPGADIDAIGAVGAGQRILLESSVLFGFDDANLRGDAVDALRSVNAAIMEQDNARVVIEGYTDAEGPEEYNVDLSQRRADAVREYLQELSTRDSDRYVSVGRGEAKPVASNETTEGSAENRRVEILILTPNSAG